MRCLALAAELKTRGLECVFVAQNLKGHMLDEVQKSGFKYIIIPTPRSEYEDATATHEIQSDWVVLDHYKLGFEWESFFKSKGKKVLTIQDFPSRKLNCDLLLDPNFHEEKDPYQTLTPNAAARLVGPKYALLRSEFSKNNSAPKSKLGHRIFVFFGATDPQKGLLKYADYLTQNTDDFEYVFVSGKTCPHNDAISKKLLSNPRMTHEIAPQNIAKLMGTCDLYLGAGGSITWERMSQGLTGIVISVADNQIPASQGLSKHGYHEYLGKIEDVSPEQALKKLKQYSQEQKKVLLMRQACISLVDGKGVQRVASQLLGE